MVKKGEGGGELGKWKYIIYFYISHISLFRPFKLFHFLLIILKKKNT